MSSFIFNNFEDLKFIFAWVYQGLRPSFLPQYTALRAVLPCGKKGFALICFANERFALNPLAGDCFAIASIASQSALLQQRMLRILCFR